MNSPPCPRAPLPSLPQLLRTCTAFVLALALARIVTPIQHMMIPFPQGQKSQFCSAHKQEGQVDVCNRRCKQAGCSKRPCFGLPGQRPCFCGTHRTAEMVDVISHKCGYPGCSHPTGHEANRVRSKFCGASVGSLFGRSVCWSAGRSADRLAGRSTGWAWETRDGARGGSRVGDRVAVAMPYGASTCVSE